MTSLFFVLLALMALLAAFAATFSLFFDDLGFWIALAIAVILGVSVIGLSYGMTYVVSYALVAAASGM